MILRALVSVLFLIVSSLPSGACCAPSPAKTAAVDHASHHDAPDRSKAAAHPAATFVCVSFCAATPGCATVTAPDIAFAGGIEPEVAHSPEGAEPRPEARPPRPS